MNVHIIIYLNIIFAVMQPVEPARILLQGTFPRNRHGQKKRIQPGLVKPFSDIAACGHKDKRAVVRQFFECFQNSR